MKTSTLAFAGLGLAFVILLTSCANPGSQSVVKGGDDSGHYDDGMRGLPEDVAVGRIAAIPGVYDSVAPTPQGDRSDRGEGGGAVRDELEAVRRENEKLASEKEAYKIQLADLQEKSAQPSPELVELKVAHEKQQAQLQQMQISMLNSEQEFSEAKAKQAAAAEMRMAKVQEEFAQREAQMDAVETSLERSKIQLDATTVMLEQKKIELDTAEAKLEVSILPAKYAVKVIAPTEMDVDTTATAIVEVRMPTVESGITSSNVAVEDTIDAIGRYLRASLSGDNFKIDAEDDLVQDIGLANIVSWSFKVTPTRTGEQNLYAAVWQSDGSGSLGSFSKQGVDSWTIQVKVGAADSMLTAVAREAGGWAVAVIAFFAGIGAELIRRQVLKKKGEGVAPDGS